MGGEVNVIEDREDVLEGIGYCKEAMSQGAHPDDVIDLIPGLSTDEKERVRRLCLLHMETSSPQQRARSGSKPARAGAPMPADTSVSSPSVQEQTKRKLHRRSSLPRRDSTGSRDSRGSG